MAGCLNDPGANGGLLEVLQAPAPENATVIEASDNRVRDVEPIQDGLRRAANETNAEIDVSDREFDTVAEALADLPWYDRVEHGSSHISGIYLRYDGDVYVVVLTPFCTDSWIRDANSERGEYGWGGCYDPEAWEEE